MNENSAWLREQREKAQQEAERAFAEQQKAAAVDTPEAPSGKSRKGRTTRTCSICRAAGLVDEAKGHISIGHDAWLARQPAHIRAHFTGQGTTPERPPKLVRRS